MTRSAGVFEGDRVIPRCTRTVMLCVCVALGSFVPDQAWGRSDNRQRHLQTQPFTQTGIASYYHHSHDGQRTASGSRLNLRSHDAAHATLPFGTIAEVKNLRNGRTVRVRIVDRMPLHSRHVIDVTPATARQLGMLRQGLERVRLTVIHRPAR